MEKKNYQDSIAVLKESTMFHMSLGSKELFHSNFLHWISLVDWKVFLEIMHGLSDTNKFWWEETDCSIPGYEGPFCPDNNNLEVRREYHHFDLSIYILDSENEDKEANNQEVVKDDEDGLAYNQDAQGARKVQKWIPVLILENKMKSIPYDEQLEQYTLDAFNEWRRGELISPCIKELKGKAGTTILEKKGISFILLSLMKSASITDVVKIPFQYYKNKYSFPFRWFHRTYSDLLSALSDKVHFKKELDELILIDYRGFLKAMIDLGERWTIDPKESFRCQVYPWKIKNRPAQNRIIEIEQYKELRIHDIHEKLTYCHLLSILDQKLSSEFKYKPKRYDAKTNTQCYQKGCRLFTKSDYAHGVGIFEVQYFVFPFNPQEKGKEDFFKLILQVQGDRYCHMLICNDIVEESDNVVGKQNKKTSVNIKNLEKHWKNSNVSIDQSIGNYISINGSNPSIFKSEPENGKYCHYGKNNIYQYVEIPENATVNDVINQMISDIKDIDEWVSKIRL